MLGLPCDVQAFSSCNKRGLVSCGWCSGVSLLSVDSRVRGLQELRLVGSRAWPQSWHVGLVAPRHVGSSCSRNWTCVPALEGGFITTRSPGKSGEYVYENVLVGAHWFIQTTTFCSCFHYVSGAGWLLFLLLSSLSCRLVYKYRTRELLERKEEVSVILPAAIRDL